MSLNYNFDQIIEILTQQSAAVLDELASTRFPVSKINDPVFVAHVEELRGKTGLYAVFCDGQLFYIGKTKSPVQRLKSHFVQCPPGTRSIISQITVLLSEKKKVEVGFAEVPIAIYSAVEEILIDKLRKEGVRLENKRAS